MPYLFFCSSKILFHMNVSVLKEKKLVFYIIYAFFWMRNTLIFFFSGFSFFFVPLCSTGVWTLERVRVKFCNNIKRRYGRVKMVRFQCFLFHLFLFFIFHVQKALMNDCRRENFPWRLPAHPYFWQAFDAALGWVVPRRWPLNGVNTPFTVHISAAAAPPASADT